MHDMIMVVDDSATDAHLVCQHLDKLGYKSLVVDCAKKAIEIAREQQPRAILMDVVMPGTNGFVATRMLRKDPQTADIPVIIVSTKKQASDRVWGLRQGAVEYLTKPVSRQTLSEKLAALL